MNFSSAYIKLSNDRFSPFSGLARLFGLLIFVGFLWGCGDSSKSPTSVEQNDPRTLGPLPLTHLPERLDKIGEGVCRECHVEEFQAWQRSHHAHANRSLDPTLDRPAFTPSREVAEGVLTYRLEWKDGTPFMIVQEEGESVSYPLEGVLAYEPLRQYLVPFPGGKWQVTTAAYDPAENEWFDVYEGEARLPHEWGSWDGQGMNWNANCAYCHNTEFQKNIVPETGAYHSSWTRQAISCVQCHIGMEEHVATATAEDGGALPRSLSEVQARQSCATCHSRRDQLTADEFRPGDSFYDHFSLALPTQPGLYYADGQIRDEVFVYGSFEMSRMGGHAGVTCMDCHDPHSMELTRPVANNSTCMWCHESGLDGATVINPVEHSHHPAESTGNRCVECHMPKTPYMQRDPRADHGFLSPDPRLTRELGIPNACSKCHSEESVEWAEEFVEEWYPEKNVLNRQRDRAYALTEAWEENPEAAEKLIALAEAEKIPAWRATYTGLLAPYVRDRKVFEFVREKLHDPSSLVRTQAAGAAAEVRTMIPEFDNLLNDPNRNVRIAAARVYAMRSEDVPHPETATEWKEYLLFNSDRPQQALLLAEKAIRDNEISQAEIWLQRAIALEPVNPELLRQVAIFYSRIGDINRATVLLEKAYSMAPGEAIFPYSLALIRAETAELEKAIQLLRVTTRLDPEFDRAWYNLALALLRNNKPQEARTALDNAETLRGSESWNQASNAIDRALRSP